MRSIRVFKPEGSGMVFDSDAVFHGFSTDFEELRDGVGQFPVAIVEFPDGSLDARPLRLVRFNCPAQASA